DLTVSRKHARIFFDEDMLRVEDLSTNGTFADDAFLQKRSRSVRYGSCIRLGQTELVVTQVASVEEPTAAEPVTADVVTAPTPVTSNDEIDALRRQMHHQLLEQLDMNAIDTGTAEDPTLRPRVLDALRRIVDAISDKLPSGLSRAALVGQMADEALGLGPLEALLADPSVSEIMVLDAHNIYVERGGRVALADCRFTDDERVRAVIERIVAPLGRRVDESSPLVDARLANGSRVNVVIRPVALRGSCITIRKFSSKPFDLSALVERAALSDAMGRFLVRSVKAKKNIVISGGTGSGKTTLLNVLSGAIPSNERIVTIEDAAELQLAQPHVVALESRPANMEGKGEISIRSLVKNALRMRPDRIVVGECRGGEALDMLQAMNTGHDGSLTTTHANSPDEALSRLETLALMAGVGLPQLAIREQISKSVHLLVQQSRLSDGSRRVTAIVEIAGLDERGRFLVRPIFEFIQRGTGPDGAVIGEFASTGYLPSYLPELIVKGLISEEEAFV
ncbi:MAG TPA: ATPase, T2SS/T4P/T4SS family, partial [Polyangiales bacterium]|nr:ATPase, T2SS/T4P/T4SS family [Polyangiales bacterium]